MSGSDTLDAVFIRLRDSNGSVLSPDKAADAATPSFTFDVSGSSSTPYYLAVSAGGSGVWQDKTGAYSITLADNGAIPAPNPSQNWTNLVDISSIANLNEGLISPLNSDVIPLLGKLGEGLTTFDQPDLASAYVKAHTITDDIDPTSRVLNVEGLDLAVQSLKNIFADVERDIPGLVSHVTQNGMFVVRLQSDNSYLASNHSWGIAVDFKVDGQVDVRGDNQIFAGLAALIPYFNREGWYSGTDFGVEDSMHFEVSLGELRDWRGVAISTQGDQPQILVGSADENFLTVNGNPSLDTNVAIGAQGQSVIVTHGNTGEVLLQATQFTELAFNGGVATDTVVIGLLNGTDIANSTVFFSGNDGDDRLNASAADKPVVASGGNGNDTLLGGSADDVLAGNADNDTIDGGGGTDTVTYSGNRANYMLTPISNDYTLIDNVGTDGTDTLIGIEMLTFADGTVNVNVAPNTAPTLTAFTSSVASGNKDSEVTVTFADLQTQGDEADVDGAVTAFVVKAVSSGTLKIGLSAATATVWDATTNNSVDATHNAYWTPDANANGTLNAFTAVAKDDGGLESVTPVQATVSVTAVPVVNVSAGVAPVEGGTTGTFTVTLDNPAPAGGLTVNYTLAGTATADSDYSLVAGNNISALTANSFVIAAGASSAVLEVAAKADSVKDANESIALTLNVGDAANTVASFAAKKDFVVGVGGDNFSSNPLSVSLGDVNADGNMDAVTANYNNHNVSLLLGDGQGGFAAQKTFAVGGYYPRSVSLCDVNGDESADVVTTTSNANNDSGYVSLSLGDGKGGFVAPQNFVLGTGNNPASVSVGDANGDGHIDLITAGASLNYASGWILLGGNVSLLLGDGQGGFSAPQIFAIGSGVPEFVSFGDVNGDGRGDVVTANSDSDNVSLLLGDGQGGFAAPQTFAVGNYPNSVSLGDVNGDGHIDIITANRDSDNMSLLLGNGQGGFAAQQTFAVGYAPYSTGLGDVNGDGNIDLVIASFYDVSLFLGDGQGGFAAPQTFATGVQSVSVSLGDASNDGRVDIFTANAASGSVSLLLNTSSTHSAVLTIVDTPPPNTAPTLTTFASAVANGNEDSQVTVTFANLQTQGNEADIEGTVTAFVIKTISSGSLKIGTSAATATPWNATTNNSVDATHNAYWTPDTNANGSLNAFTAVAKDNGGLESAAAIQAMLNITPTNDKPSFAVGDGIVITDFGSSTDHSKSVTVQVDGKILVTGDSDSGSNNGNSNLALVRYNSNGSLDTSFSGDGIVATKIGFFSGGQSVTVQADSKILVAGYSAYDFALVRYNSDGSLDTSFDSDGIVTTDFGFDDKGQSVAIQADGKILVAGR